MKYKILSDQVVESLEHSVQWYLDRGWSLSGGLAVRGSSFYQPITLVKIEVKPTKRRSQETK